MHRILYFTIHCYDKVTGFQTPPVPQSLLNTVSVPPSQTATAKFRCKMSRATTLFLFIVHSFISRLNIPKIAKRQTLLWDHLQLWTVDCTTRNAGEKWDTAIHFITLCRWVKKARSEDLLCVSCLPIGDFYFGRVQHKLDAEVRSRHQWTCQVSEKNRTDG